MQNQGSNEEVTWETALVPSQNIADDTSNYLNTNENSFPPPNSNSFTRFQDLPKELRLTIWEFSCESPRYVDIWMRSIQNIKCPSVDEKYRADTEAYLNSVTHRPVYKSYAGPVPTILHTSQEARTVGLKYFSALFKEYNQKIPVPSRDQPQLYQVPPQFYFNQEEDVLIFPPAETGGFGCGMLNCMREKIRSGLVRKIAISTLEGLYIFFPLKTTLQEVFVPLKEVVLYYIPEDQKPLFKRFDDRNPVDYEFRPLEDPTVDASWPHARPMLESAANDVRHRHAQSTELYRLDKSGLQSPGELPSIRLMVLQIKPRL